MMEKRDDVESSDATQEQEQGQDVHLSCPKNMSDLNDDCLIQIFQQLNVSDRLRLEGVCKRWQAVLEESWYDLKTLLYFGNIGWGLKELGELGKVSTLNLEKVLNRCGRYIKCVYFHNLYENVLGTIAQHCPNIEDVHADQLNLTPTDLRVFAEKCSKIVKLSLRRFNLNPCDEVLALLFSKNNKLRSLYLGGSSNLTGECLAALNADSIEEICFVICPNVSVQHLDVLRNFNNLKVLKLCESIPSTNHNIETVETLKELMAKLSNIEVLNLSGNNLITDDMLVVVGNNCKSLKDIDISECSSVTNRGVAAILALPDLESLCMIDLDGTNDEVFKCAPKLKILDCSVCVNMRDDGIARLIKNSHQIKEILLFGCEQITKGLISDAIRYTKLRQNGIVLTIYVNSEYISDLSEITDSSPLLKVEFEYY